MRANLDITRGLIMSEAVMMGLWPPYRPQYATISSLRHCRQVIATGRPAGRSGLPENKEVRQASRSRGARKALRFRRNYLGQAAKLWTGLLAGRQEANEARRAALAEA